MNGPVLTVDLGNSRSHWALFENGKEVSSGDFRSTDQTTDFRPLFESSKETPPPTGIVACSVSPLMTSVFERQSTTAGIPCVFLNHENAGNLKLGYTNPAQIGPDRIANALGAGVHFEPPFVIADIGTAVTVDAVTRKNGYEGGVIAPGLSLYLEYLSEKAALLPVIDFDKKKRGLRIGKSTRDAMEIGCTAGFDGMMLHLIDTVISEVVAIDHCAPEVLLTGGSFDSVKEGPLGKFPFFRRLSLEGLYSRAEDLLQI